MSFSDQICSFFVVVVIVVVVVVVGVVVNLSHFIFFFRTTEPISTKLGTKHPWVKGIQTGYNYNIAKIHWRNLKIFFSKITGTISAKLKHKAFLGKGLSGLLKKGPHPYPREGDYDIAKIHSQNLKCSSPDPLLASLGEGNSSLFKWRTPLFSKGR